MVGFSRWMQGASIAVLASLVVGQADAKSVKSSKQASKKPSAAAALKGENILSYYQWAALSQVEREAYIDGLRVIAVNWEAGERFRGAARELPSEPQTAGLHPIFFELLAHAVPKAQAATPLCQDREFVRKGNGQICTNAGSWYSWNYCTDQDLSYWTSYCHEKFKEFVGATSRRLRGSERLEFEAKAGVFVTQADNAIAAAAKPVRVIPMGRTEGDGAVVRPVAEEPVIPVVSAAEAATREGADAERAAAPVVTEEAAARPPVVVGAEPDFSAALVPNPAVSLWEPNPNPAVAEAVEKARDEGEGRGPACGDTSVSCEMQTHSTKSMDEYRQAYRAEMEALPREKRLCVIAGFTSVLNSRKKCTPITEWEVGGKWKGRCTGSNTMCNPLLFGVKSDGKPICVPLGMTVTTECWSQATKMGNTAKKVSEQLLGKSPEMESMGIDNIADRWSQLRKNIAALCNRGSASLEFHCNECTSMSIQIKSMNMASVCADQCGRVDPNMSDADCRTAMRGKAGSGAGGGPSSEGGR